MGRFPMHPVVPRLLGTPGSIRTPAPKLGQDNRGLLKELGFKDSDMKRLVQEKVISGEA